MWQPKRASAVPKNLGLGLNFFWPFCAVKAISSLCVRSPCLETCEKVVVLDFRIGCWVVVSKICYTIKITIRPTTKGFCHTEPSRSDDQKSESN